MGKLVKIAQENHTDPNLSPAGRPPRRNIRQSQADNLGVAGRRVDAEGRGLGLETGDEAGEVGVLEGLLQ